MFWQPVAPSFNYYTQIHRTRTYACPCLWVYADAWHAKVNHRRAWTITVSLDFPCSCWLTRCKIAAEGWVGYVVVLLRSTFVAWHVFPAPFQTYICSCMSSCSTGFSCETKSNDILWFKCRRVFLCLRINNIVLRHFHI